MRIKREEKIMPKKTIYIFLCIFMILPIFAFSQETKGITDTEKSQINAISSSISQMTGIAINPLAVTTILGIYRNITTDSTEEAWYYSPLFLTVCGILVLISLLSSFSNILNFPPQVSSVIEQSNKIIGLAITLPVVLEVISPVSSLLSNTVQSAILTNEMYVYASIFPVELLNMLPGIIWGAITTIIMFFIYISTWLVNFTFDALVFLSPFGLVDSVLKTIRGAYLGLLAILTAIYPPLSLIITLPVIIIAIILFAKSVRKVAAGLVLMKDFANKKKDTFLDNKGILVFSEKGIGIAAKHMCRLIEKDNKWIFVYRKYFIFKKEVIIDKLDSTLKSGFIYSEIYNNGKLICSLPLRYKKIAIQVQNYLEINKLDDTKLNKGIKAVVDWIKNIFPQKIADEFI